MRYIIFHIQTAIYKLLVWYYLCRDDIADVAAGEDE